MVTAAEVKKLIKPLLERHDDLALVGRWLHVKPIHHLARAVLIDRTSTRRYLSARWTVTHLFEARSLFPLDWGDFLYYERSPGRAFWWPIDHPDVASDLMNSIETHALPALRALKTLDDYLAYVSEHPFRQKIFGWPHVRIIVETALGNLDAARNIGEGQIAYWSTVKPDYDQETREQFARLRELYRLLVTGDRTGLAELLHSWELSTVRAFKIGPFWSATPFPLELKR